MREGADAALRRYEAMAGRLEGIPEKAERQSERDRERFGQQYLWRRADGCFMWNDLMVIRFLTEVCGLPLRESREAVIEDCRVKGIAMGADMPPPAGKAKELFREFGNVLEAHAIAAFWKDVFADDDSAARYWRDVILHIETARFVTEDTGIGNWD